MSFKNLKAQFLKRSWACFLVTMTWMPMVMMTKVDIDPDGFVAVRILADTACKTHDQKSHK